MSFPEIIYGKCPVCGNAGQDDPSPGNCDAEARDTTGSGVILIYYEGKLMCEPCRTIQIGKKDGKLASKKHAEAARFRGRAGFVNTIS